MSDARVVDTSLSNQRTSFPPPVIACSSTCEMPELPVDSSRMNADSPLLSNSKLMGVNNKTRLASTSNSCASDSTATLCKLDSFGCLTLDQVLETFNSPINEEQAWAICFQFVQCVRSLNRKRAQYEDRRQVQRCADFVSPPTHNNNHERLQLHLHQRGFVHENTLFAQVPLSECSLENEQELLMTFGLTIFNALDYKIASDEELSISSPLESLLERLTLEMDEYESPKLNSNDINLDAIYEICCSRLLDRDQASAHYQEICRNLVTETLELSMFLHTVYEGTKIRDKLLKELPSTGETQLFSYSSKEDDMQLVPLANWAKLWMQVLQELRSGHRHLRPVTPKVKRDENNESSHQTKAHELILHYIRSRPALMPVQKRKLGPPLRPPTRSLLDQLHECIRKGNIKLRPVQVTERDNQFSPLLGRVCDNPKTANLVNQSSSSLDNSPMVQKKKLIKPDIHWNFDLDDDEFMTSSKRYSSLF